MPDLTGIGFSQTQSVQYEQVTKLYGRSRKGKDKDQDGDSESSSFSIEDILDIKNSNGVTASADTVMSMLEEKVNKRIDAAFQDQNVDTESQDYWSPKATAGRIVGFALKYYDKFAQKSGGESEANLDKFLSIVKGAINEGIGEAETEISKTAGGSVPDSNKATIAKTREYIDNLLEEFRKSALERIRSGKSGSDAATETGLVPVENQQETPTESSPESGSEQVQAAQSV